MQHIRICNILRHLPTHAIEIITLQTAWLPSDNMATWLAQSDDFVDAYRAYTNRAGINFEGVKTAASLGNIMILKCAFEICAARGISSRENVVIAAIVGAARTTNMRTIIWLDIARHFGVLKRHTDTPKVIRDTALSTNNHAFIDACMVHFKGCRTLIDDLHNFNTVIYMRKLACAELTVFPAGGITTDAHMRYCDALSHVELCNLFASCAERFLINSNMRFVRYFVDKCELEYPKLRIPWKRVKFLSAEFMIEMLHNRSRLQADCVSCMFHNIFNHRRGYRGDYILDYELIVELLHAGFKWHRKLKRIVKRLYPHRREIRESGILEALIENSKNKYLV